DMYQYNIDFLAKKKPRTDLFTAVKIELKTGVAHELILIPQGCQLRWTPSKKPLNHKGTRRGRTLRGTKRHEGTRRAYAAPARFDLLGKWSRIKQKNSMK
ncbi:MAG: hypothetical protein RBT25_07615, partial [Lentisphaeria bacterium]|nr:hypothetical protein [Lentisphaeria bacterium]